MSKAQLQVAADGVLSLQGELNFTGVAALWPQLRQAIVSAQGGSLTLSLAAVSSANSAALALLLEARQLAEGRGIGLRLHDLPEGLKELATLSNALDLLT